MSEIQTVYDLRASLPPVRDQGPRPTCLAFAVSDAHALRRRSLEPLSVEYLFYHAVQRSHKDPRHGASVRDTRAVLERNGQPREEDWPYKPIDPSLLVSNWTDPITKENCFRRMSSEPVWDWAEIHNSLKDGEPVVGIIELPIAFYRPASAVINVANGEKSTGARHAVVFVGSGKVFGEDALLIRNSWGSGWGDNGHAWMKWSDLTKFLLSVVLLGDEPDVLTNTAAA